MVVYFIMAVYFCFQGCPLQFFVCPAVHIEKRSKVMRLGLLEEVVAVNLARKLRGEPPIAWDAETVLGALALHVSTPTDNFQPMNANYGILRPLAEHIRDKALKKRKLAERSLARIGEVAAGLREQI